jgi:hypothetical protein
MLRSGAAQLLGSGQPHLDVRHTRVGREDGFSSLTPREVIW